MLLILSKARCTSLKRRAFSIAVEMYKASVSAIARCCPENPFTCLDTNHVHPEQGFPIMHRYQITGSDARIQPHPPGSGIHVRYVQRLALPGRQVGKPVLLIQAVPELLPGLQKKLRGMPALLVRQNIRLSAS